MGSGRNATQSRPQSSSLLRMPDGDQKAKGLGSRLECHIEDKRLQKEKKEEPYCGFVKTRVLPQNCLLQAGQQVDLFLFSTVYSFICRTDSLFLFRSFLTEENS